MSSSNLGARVQELLSVGSLFGGKYRVAEPLGTGSFAYVMRARHEVMGRDVALKVLKPELVRSNPDVSDRFLKEVQIVSRLSHPNTVTVFDFGETPEGIYYMVFEHVRGVSLDEVLAEGAMDPERVAHICKQVLKSLAEAHALGIVHRDLKPSNIMLTEVHGEKDFVKVLDFGVAKLVGEGESPLGSGRGRRSTQFIGTPVYMSPEQVLGQAVSPASDLYSLGLIVYEMLTGDPPVEAENVATMAQQHVDEAPLPFPKLGSLSRRYQTMIRRATARYPSDRFPDARTFARHLPRSPGEDLTAEFEKTRMMAAMAGLPTVDGEISESEVDVFSGRKWVGLPDDSEPAFLGEAAGRREEKPARTTPAAPARSAERLRQSPRTPGPAQKKPLASQGRLELDLERVKREQLDRRTRRQRPQDRQAKTAGGLDAGEHLRRGAIYLGGILAAYAGFVLLSALFPRVTPLMRFAAGIAPIAVAALWTAFSPFRTLNGDLGERWLAPIALNLMAVVGLTIVAAALVFPGDAHTAVYTHGAWFLGKSADGLSGALTAFNRIVTGALGAVFSVASRLVPW